MAVRLLALPPELAQELLLGAIGNHPGRNSIALKQRGQGLVGLALGLHWVHAAPAIGRAISLGALVTALGLGPSKHAVGENGVWQSLVSQHTIIGGESARQGWMKAGSDVPLRGLLNGVLGLVGVNAPAVCEGGILLSSASWTPCRHCLCIFCPNLGKSPHQGQD